MTILTTTSLESNKRVKIKVKSKFVCKLLLGTCGAKGCLASLS